MKNIPVSPNTEQMREFFVKNFERPRHMSDMSELHIFCLSSNLKTIKLDDKIQDKNYFFPKIIQQKHTNMYVI